MRDGKQSYPVYIPFLSGLKRYVDEKPGPEDLKESIKKDIEKIIVKMMVLENGVHEDVV